MWLLSYQSNAFNYHYRTWTVKVKNGECIGNCGDPRQTHSHLEYFLMLFPSSQLNLIVNLTNMVILQRIERTAQ